MVDEAGSGDSAQVKLRLEILRALESLPANETAEALTSALIVAGALPKRAAIDAAHIAITAVHNIDYLLTWNCKHIANATHFRKIKAVCNAEGYRTPILCTPEELTESMKDE